MKRFVVFVLAVGLCSAMACRNGYCNVARGGMADSSSISGGKRPYRAIDGNTDGDIGNLSCSSTQYTRDNWWSVELTHALFDLSYPISHVVIHNRVDCCGARLDGVEVYVQEGEDGEQTLCGAVDYVAGQTAYQVDCNGTSGDRVKIVQPPRYTQLTLCEVMVMVAQADARIYRNPYVDIARNGTAVQSTTQTRGAASRAIDGDLSGWWGDESCTLTSPDTGNKWTLTLEEGEIGTQYPVNKVIVYNRQDEDQERIGGARVWVGDELCGEITYSETSDVYTVDCNDKWGSTVSITQDNSRLSLCEVQVYVHEDEAWQTKLINIAPRGEAYQSTNKAGNAASRAIDGNTNGNLGEGSCSQTQSGSNTWSVVLPGWEVGAAYTIQRVIVHSREAPTAGESIEGRINGAKVWVGTHMCGQILYDGSTTYTLECSAASGNKVIVQLEDNYLTLCEVEVIVEESSLPSVPTWENVAQGRAATQYNTKYGGAASRAVDGDTNSVYSNQNGSCSMTRNKAGGGTWWKVALDEVAAVQAVVIYNRLDASPEKIDGLQVWVGETWCGRVAYDAGAVSYAVMCGEGEGNEVTVKQDGDGTITMCELQVAVIEEQGTEVMDEEYEDSAF